MDHYGKVSLEIEKKPRFKAAILFHVPIISE